jgi:hypothetical protein
VKRDVPPTVNDDWDTQGYRLMTVWHELDDLVTPTEIVGSWLLVDNSAGAAIWLSTGGMTAAAVQALISAHAAEADPHTGYVREADANWTALTGGGATALHTHADGGAGGLPLTAVVNGEPVLLWDEDNSLIGAS